MKNVLGVPITAELNTRVKKFRKATLPKNQP